VSAWGWATERLDYRIRVGRRAKVILACVPPSPARWCGAGCSGVFRTARPLHDLLATSANASPLAGICHAGVTARIARAGRIGVAYRVEAHRLGPLFGAALLFRQKQTPAVSTLGSIMGPPGSRRSTRLPAGWTRSGSIILLQPAAALNIISACVPPSPAPGLRSRMRSLGYCSTVARRCCPRLLTALALRRPLYGNVRYLTSGATAKFLCSDVPTRVSND